MSIYTSNYRNRLDISYILYHAQTQLVETRTNKYSNSFSVEDDDKIRATDLHKHFRNWIKEQGLLVDNKYNDTHLGLSFKKILLFKDQDNRGKFYFNVHFK